MRFIKHLTPETIHLLTRIQKESQYPRVRKRAYCILLSFQGYSIKQMQDIFQVNRVTVYNWLNAWESSCLLGLYDKKGRGRPTILLPEQKEQIWQWHKMFPKSTNKIRTLIKEKFEIVVSKQTVERVWKT